MSRISFHRAGDPHPITPGDETWNTPLPLDRRGEGSPRFTLGDYFTAVHDIISAQGYALIVRAITRSGEGLCPEGLVQVRIIEEKHGEFYHPARLEVTTGEAVLSLVANVALTPNGRACLAREYDLLTRLNVSVTPSFLPRVYARGETRSPSGHCVSLFLGEWLTGFHEFHLSRDPKTSTPGVRIWSQDGTFPFLSASQTRDLYFHCARILTHYYQPRTYAQIFPWHHAAGDFVVSLGQDQVQVRLVTVRQYAPAFGGGPAESDIDILRGLLLFLLNLSIRARIDRIDGTGDLIWAPAVAVRSTVEGFLCALEDLLETDPDLAPIVREFKDFTALFAEGDLFDFCTLLLDACDPRSKEIDFIRGLLADHIRLLREVFRDVV